MMKTAHDVNLTKHSKGYLKTRLKARLSILILSKAYPTKGITQPFNQACKVCEGFGFLLLKSNKEQVLNFKFQLLDSSWINHSRFAPIYTSMVEKLFASNKIEYYHCSTSYSVWQRDQVVSISARDGQFKSDFQPCKVNLTHTFGTPSGRSQTTVNLSFRLVDRVTLPDYRAPTSSLYPWCCAT